MKIAKFYCDKCHRDICGVVYTLTCTASITGPRSATLEEMKAAATQNIRQSNADQRGAVHICRDCKDDLTDGLFIVVDVLVGILGNLLGEDDQ